MTTSNHCWLPSLLDSSTGISSQKSYSVPLFLAGLTQVQHIGATLQSHLFGTELKTLALWWGERSGEAQGDKGKVDGVDEVES